MVAVGLQQPAAQGRIELSQKLHADASLRLRPRCRSPVPVYRYGLQLRHLIDADEATSRYNISRYHWYLHEVFHVACKRDITAIVDSSLARKQAQGSSTSRLDADTSVHDRCRSS
nr:hypothetical protein CFP56_16777 [Quercus suber]